MPRPNAPPTPGSSSDLRGKEGAPTAPTFHLPPNAFQDIDRASTSSATPSANGSDSSYRPVSPTSPAETSRKRPAPPQQSSGTGVITKDDFALPPPPTRSRKIIQMKPRQSGGEAGEDQIASTTAAAAATQSSGKGAAAGGKKGGRNASNTTAAGRKIARKTAHSLIERRRRSKMNEEFGVLKDMIPACKGQEMHKLAILQASIDYLRYLERCVADLQAAQNTSPQSKPRSTSRLQPNIRPEPSADEDEDEEMDEGDEEDEDNEPEAEEIATASSTPATNPADRSASLISLPSLSQITTTTTSPSVFSTGGRHYSISSASQASYSPYFHSNQTSPAFGPQLSSGPTGATLPPPYASSRETFGLGSPAMRPLDSRKGFEGLEMPEAKQRRLTKTVSKEQDLDHEATAALLMLNHDRRSWRGEREGGRSGAGMSVKDLLSG